MKKYFLFHSFLCLMITGLLFLSCNKNSGDPPAPTGGSLTNVVAKPDSALPGTLVDINGTGLQGIKSAHFDTVSSTINPVYNTSTDLLVYVPSSPTYGWQNITLRNGLGGSVQIKFKVVQPAPIIAAVAPLSAQIGDTITITGTFFKNIISVLAGAIPATIVDSSNSSILKFRMPAGFTSGLVTVVTVGGSITSTTTLAIERSVLIADFDGGGIRPDGNSWYSYGDMSSKTVTNTNPAPLSGNFIQAIAATTGTTGYGGISTYTVSSGPQTLELTSSAAATSIKFDANSNGYNTTQIQVNLGDASGNNYNRIFAANWNGWQTVTLNLADFYFGYGTDAQTPSTMLIPANITTVKFHFVNYVGNQSEINLDNIRFTF